MGKQEVSRWQKFKAGVKKVFSRINWFFKEILKIYSTEDSYFSKKRIESGAAFVVGQFGMVYFLIQSIDTMTTQDLLMWAGTEFVIAGYTVSQIQKEKKRKDENGKPDSGGGPELLNE